jgi:hypothetical protein
VRLPSPGQGPAVAPFPAMQITVGSPKPGVASVPPPPPPTGSASPGQSTGNPAPHPNIADLELQLADATTALMQSDSINPFWGSVPVERIQNAARAKHAELYNAVVGSRHNSWRRFVERHPDAFHLFALEDGKSRMRLIQHVHWEEGDRREVEERRQREAHLALCLDLHLRGRPNGFCRVDEFMNAYPSLPPNCLPGASINGTPVHALPARGDLVRFVRRHADRFVYDADTLSMGLKPEGPSQDPH